MKKKNIVRKNIDFQRIIQNYRPYKYKDYIIYSEKTKEETYHFGLSVGKKIGCAVERNRIRRQLKAIIDENVYQNGINCIIIVGRGIKDRSFLEMRANLLEAFQKLDMMKGTNK